MAQRRRQQYQDQPDDFEVWQPEPAAPAQAQQPDDFEPWEPEPAPAPSPVQAQQPEPIQAQQPDDFVPWEPEPQQPQAEGMIGTALRSAAHAAVPSVAGTAAIPAGIAGGGLLGLPTAGLGAVPGAVVGGVGAYMGASKLQDTALKAMGFDDSQQVAVNAKTNPISALAGEIIGALPTVGIGAGIKAVTRLGGAIGGGLLEAGGQALGNEPWDPTRIGGAAAAGSLLIKPTRLGEAVGSGTAKAIGRPELWHGSGGPDAAGTSKEQPPPRQTPDAGAELPTDYYAKPPRVTEGEAPSGERPPQVFEDEAPAAAEAAPPPQVTPVDPAIDAAVNKRPIEPRVTPVEEPPTQYGPALDREFPRVTEMPAETPPVIEAPGVENLARTPREAMVQKAPEETYGQVLRRLASDERGGGGIPRKPTTEEPGAGPVAKAGDEATLPKELAGVKPRYAYGSKQFQPEFASDIDKALFITAQTNKSKSDAKYRDWLVQQGISSNDIDRFGATVRSVIKDQAANAPEGGQLPIGPITRRPRPAPTAEAMPTPGVFEGPKISGAKAKADAALADRSFTPEQIAAMKPKEKTAILQKREGEVGSGPKGDAMLRREAEVRAGPAEAPAAEMLDLKLANRMLNQPAILRSEAAKRGITPEALKAQATEVLKTAPEAPPPGRPAVLTPTGGAPAAAPATKPAKPRGRPNAAVPPATAAATGGAPPVTPPITPAAAAPPPATPPPAGPTLRAAHAKDLAEGLWPAIRRVFAPESTPSGRAGMDVFREHKGQAVQMREAQLARFSDAMHHATNKMSDMDQRKLVNYIEGGEHLNTPGHAIHDPNYQPPSIIRRVADQIKQAYEVYAHELNQLPQAAQASFIHDYLTHMYKNPDPLIEGGWGSAGFGSLKKRVHETYEHAREAGLEPLTNNPIEIFTRYAMGAERAITKQKTINDLEARGYLDWFKPKSLGATGSPEPLTRGTPPEGYAPVNAFVNKQGATAYVPRDMAYMLNHQFGPTFQSPAGEKIMDSVRRFKNFTTNLELGMSLYHPFTVGVETIASGVARSFAEAGSRPDQIARAARSFIRAWGEPISNVPLGKEWIERYTGKRASSAEQQRILDAMTAADIRPVGIGHTMEYDMTSSARKSMGELGSLWTSYKRGSLEREFKGALQDIMGGDWKQGLTLVPNVAARVLRTAAAPIFETYIPRLKVASTVLDLQAYLAANPTATKEQLAAVARKTSDSIDNRMGEMVTDHLGMNKAWKAAAFTAMRSFSFTIGGPFREVGGGALSGAKGMVSGENRLSMASGAYDPRVAYAIAFPFTMVALASMYNFMRTGEWPQDWRDTVTPRTGGEVMSGGQPAQERVLLPGYHKDFLGYAFHPTDEVKAKMAGVWGAFYEQISGKDYRGDPIAPPASAAGVGANIAGRVEHLAQRLTPLSFKQLSEPSKEGSNISLVEQGLGFRAPGAYIQNPERVGQIKNIVEQKAWRTRERHINQDRAAKGLPPLPPMQFTGGQ